jgi:hypothetical protein
MFWEAVYLPECLDKFLNISQILDVQKFLHRYLSQVSYHVLFWKVTEHGGHREHRPF